ncbi:MAG: NADP-dependent isocitrate dehydrogenase [Fimbriimonadaceae bacterium]|nr:NADP-dependent isocitrate dehydrogenase [Fimbriimonadaceae bacterium]
MTETTAAVSPMRILTRPKLEIALAPGDGIGPEITAAVIKVLEAAQAPLKFVPIEVGLAAYEAGEKAGISAEALETVRAHKVLLKGPITTPQGGGFKSVNVTLRKSLGMFANVRPCMALAPVVPGAHPNLDIVVIRENEEDLYAGIEHRQTEDVVQCLKLITRPGCERIVRYAFEYAVQNGRKKITCMTKDNIMKLTDGLFHRVFDEIGAEYPQIEKEHMIIDIGIAKIARDPARFDIILAPNLYGDIISDVVAEVSGSVGTAPSANIGEDIAMFEAVHGSAPDIAGKGVANPSGMLLAAVMMLAHIGDGSIATTIHNAWLKAIEDGCLTADLDPSRGYGTEAFADAVIARLGERPTVFEPVQYPPKTDPVRVWVRQSRPPKKTLVGVDLFLASRESAETIAARIQRALGKRWTLEMITNRGVKVWPNGLPETNCVDHYRCRLRTDGIGTPAIAGAMVALDSLGLEVVKTENLYDFDGQPGYSVGQGQ